jgi:hypothetical protein
MLNLHISSIFYAAAFVAGALLFRTYTLRHLAAVRAQSLR